MAIAISVGLVSFFFVFLYFDETDSSKDSSVFAKEIFTNCNTDVNCPTKVFQEISNKEEQVFVLQTFSDVVQLYNDSEYPCHQTSHHLGMWVYDYTQNFDKAFGVAEMLCGGGPIHGVIQQFFVTEYLEIKEILDDDLLEICPKTSEQPHSIMRWQCLHGIGHGLLAVSDYDVFSSLEKCEIFEPGWEQLSCSKGVFMQNVVYNFDTGGGNFMEDDKLFPCNKVEEKFVPACYHYHASYILKKNDFEMYSSFGDCDEILPVEFVKYCYHGMGRQAEIDIKGSMQRAVTLCTAGKQAIFHSDCLRGMLMTIINRDENPDIGFQFCRSLPTEFKADCYDGLGKWIQMLKPTLEERKKLCSNSESSTYSEICISANLESELL